MRDRAFLFAVACVSVLAVFILVRNVRESTAPLYGPPTVDREAVMTKVETGALSFREALFYVREGDAGSEAPPDKTEGASAGGIDIPDRTDATEGLSERAPANGDQDRIPTEATGSGRAGENDALAPNTAGKDTTR